MSVAAVVADGDVNPGGMLVLMSVVETTQGGEFVRVRDIPVGPAISVIQLAQTRREVAADHDAGAVTSVDGESAGGRPY